MLSERPITPEKKSERESSIDLTSVLALPSVLTVRHVSPYVWLATIGCVRFHDRLKIELDRRRRHDAQRDRRRRTVTVQLTAFDSSAPALNFTSFEASAASTRWRTGASSAVATDHAGTSRSSLLGQSPVSCLARASRDWTPQHQTSPSSRHTECAPGGR